jgi:hypothetical protein
MGVVIWVTFLSLPRFARAGKDRVPIVVNAE